MNSNFTQPTKRPVGRPKSVKPEPQIISRQGVVAEPVDNTNVLEFAYNEPLNIKRVFSLLKLMCARDIRLDFKLNNIRISGTGHVRNNYVDLHIDATKLTKYYCRHNMICVVDGGHLERIMQKIDKSYSSIHFIAKQESYMKEIYIVLQDEDSSVKEYHTISLLESANIQNDIAVSNLSYNNYPLSFEMTSKYFKKIISDIGRFSKQFTVERRPGVILSFPYEGASGMVHVNHVFSNAETFKIYSTLDEQEFISTSVHIDDVQCLASSMIGAMVKVYIDHEQMMVFKTSVDDDTFILYLGVKIVSYK